MLQWLSQLVGSTSVEQPPGSNSQAQGSVTPLTAHLQCHHEIAVAAVGMCELSRCIDCSLSSLIPRLLSSFCDWEEPGNEAKYVVQSPVVELSL